MRTTAQFPTTEAKVTVALTPLSANFQTSGFASSYNLKPMTYLAYSNLLLPTSKSFIQKKSQRD